MNDVIWGRTEQLLGGEPCAIFQPSIVDAATPILYLLHGQFDAETDWFGAKGQLPGILSGLGAPAMILVMPFCGAVKTTDPRQQQDPGLDAFARRFEAIQRLIGERFGNRATGVLGISMGGRQALHLVLTGRVANLAGVGVLSGKLQPPYADQLRAAVKNFGQAPLAVPLYFHYCGQGGTDAPYFDGNQQVCAALGGVLRTRADADHNWWFWRQRIAEFVREFRAIRPAPA